MKWPNDHVEDIIMCFHLQIRKAYKLLSAIGQGFLLTPCKNPWP